jgi:hypothetical protein
MLIEFLTNSLNNSMELRLCLLLFEIHAFASIDAIQQSYRTMLGRNATNDEAQHLSSVIMKGAQVSYGN